MCRLGDFVTEENFQPARVIKVRQVLEEIPQYVSVGSPAERAERRLAGRRATEPVNPVAPVVPVKEPVRKRGAKPVRRTIKRKPARTAPHRAIPVELPQRVPVKNSDE